MCKIPQMQVEVYSIFVPKSRNVTVKEFVFVGECCRMLADACPIRTSLVLVATDINTENTLKQRISNSYHVNKKN